MLDQFLPRIGSKQADFIVTVLAVLYTADLSLDCHSVV
jgi:hypothetical protein